ncbi:uncharacterized protein BP5553_06346 [Venustampulla echinocandica]|uniref:Uncharacterized protein n=1 Tax=Venustampulla echinocandica TaxID=2656787 RepID=A0A370TJN7_9HELO|nr:uncharacterized protein BP5553_06346 [Venustampulla echinocandica]RDL35734.1 hypothetical protein BP5553_06346 [Venustampulla echinocandica]
MQEDNNDSGVLPLETSLENIREEIVAISASPPETTPDNNPEGTIVIDTGDPLPETALNNMSEDTTAVGSGLSPPQTSLNMQEDTPAIDIGVLRPGTAPINIHDTIAIGSGLPPQELLVEASKSVAPSLLTTLTIRLDSIPQISNLAALEASPYEQDHVYEPDFLMQPQRGFKHEVNPDKLMYNNMNSIHEGRFPWMRYPPPANAAYTLDSDGHDPKLHYKWQQHHRLESKVRHYDWQPSRDDLVREGGNRNLHEDLVVGMVQDAFDDQETVTRGEVLANDIKFDRVTWVMGTPGVSGIVYPPEEQREEFISNINDNEDGGGDMEKCSKCGQFHIIPGSPITLADRDTCLSQLPDWFPREFANTTKNPWDIYIQLLNSIVLVEEVEKGYNHQKDPTGPEWDLHFHAKGEQWSTLHARDWGGWWKCRSGKNAPDAERKCRHCHRTKTAEEKKTLLKKKGPSLSVRKQFLQATMERLFKEQGQKDKDAALEMLRRDGIPQYYGPPIDDAAKSELFQKQALLRAKSIPDIFQNWAAMRASAHVDDVEAEADREAYAESEEFSSTPRPKPITSFFL